MKVVIDTNVLLMSIPRISKYRQIFDALLSAKYELAISESILQEYIEIIGKKTTGQIAQNLAELFSQLNNVTQTEVYFHWDLITADPDDNKFVDCAVSANVQFIVTNDNHFNLLRQIDFPPVAVISADEFLEKLTQI